MWEKIIAPIKRRIEKSNRDTRTRREICSKLTIKTPERRYCCRSGVFIVNFEHISHFVISVSIANFEHVIAGWEIYHLHLTRLNFDRFEIEAIPKKCFKFP